MNFDTSAYQFAHGRKPRGWGHWWMEVTGGDANGRFITETYQVTGTIPEARKRAMARMRAEVGGVRRIFNVVVCP